MKINAHRLERTGERSGTTNNQRVVIGELKKESQMLDINGNLVDRRTRKVIKLAKDLE